MLYLLFVLTFLCGILFYGMSPHDKSLDMTTHQAEGMIVSFINQHQAAKDYLYTWLGGSSADTTGNLQHGDYENFLKAEENGGGKATFFNFEQMIPKGLFSDVCFQNKGVPGQDSCQKDGSGERFPGFVSRVVRDDEKYYVVTYGGWDTDDSGNLVRPAWWPRPGNRMRRFESWRKAMANRTRGSISCGTLFQEGDNWCIDNGETVYKNESATTKACMNQVPTAVISSLPYSTDSGKDDLLLCYSEFKQGVKPGHYAVTPTYFYDGLSNAGVGQHQKSERFWTNLVNGTTLTLPFQDAVPKQVANWIENDPYLSLSGFLNTQIQLGNTYTLTVLVSAYSSETIPIGLLQTTDASNINASNLIINKDNITTIFKKQGKDERLEGTDAVKLVTASTEKTTSICNMNENGYTIGIVSWTFVVDGTQLDVYENAMVRFQDETITSTNGQYLVLGSDSGSNVPYIYGIRYYSSALTPEQIQKNFKVDQKRFGISDINNGKKDDGCVNISDVHNSWEEEEE